MAQFKITKGGFQGNVTGSLYGTASWAINTTSASYASYADSVPEFTAVEVENLWDSIIR